ncbi:LysR family transcriptional regulator [uncultured Jannaschia sp.]|uniref:LysR family transcriptional regulator n=1 Tax=uncultured Jannaschia sp. TaxID=293347 RepID=UPI0026097427|nr:LysR family transcriptional regulator [uncultured Jannaschia sp.]
MKTTDPMMGIFAFLAVADRSSFTAAAGDLGMGRAAVGAQIRALEARLGVRLLQRSTRSVTLTDAGAAYREALGGVHARVLDAEQVAMSFQTKPVGRLRISAPPVLGPAHIAPVIERYLAENPGVSIEMELSTERVDLVGRGFDLAIRGALAVEPTLVTRQIGSTRFIACASPAYLADHGTPMTPDELSTHACLHFSGLRWGRAWRFRRGDESVGIPILPRFECNDGQTLMAAAMRGAGIVFEPSVVVGAAIRKGALVPILTDWQLPDIPLHAAYPTNRNIARKVRRFVDMLAQSFGNDPDLAEMGNSGMPLPDNRD